MTEKLDLHSKNEHAQSLPYHSISSDWLQYCEK